MDVVRTGEIAGGQDHYPRRHRVEIELYRAPGTGGAAHRPLRQSGRPRQCHRRQRLRLRHLGRAGRGRSRCGAGQAGGDGRGRAARLATILEGLSRLAPGLRLFYDAPSHRTAPREQEVPMANDVSTITKPVAKLGYTSAKKPTMTKGRRDFFSYRDLDLKAASAGQMRGQIMKAK